MDKIDFDALILHERNKIWEDRLKLIEQHKPSDLLQRESFTDFNCEGDDENVDTLDDSENLENKSPTQHSLRRPTTNHYVGALSRQSPFRDLLSESDTLPHEGKNSEGIHLHIRVPKANTEPRMATMVRYGEYSPLNPNLLSPGKSLLGLGEYEEKRRQMMNRKKQEYREYLAQARQYGNKSTTPRKSNESTKQTNLFPDTKTNQNDVNGNKSLLTLANASTNTMPTQTSKSTNQTNRIADREVNLATQNYSSNIQRHIHMPLTNASTNTTPEQVTRDVQTDPEWERGAISLNFNDGTQMVLSPSYESENNWKLNNLRNQGGIAKDTILDVTSPTDESDWVDKVKRNNATVETVKFLSPRERKLADLQESAAMSPNSCGSELSARDDSSPMGVQSVLKIQREAYKEELRKQIAEKQKSDAELREKARLEEEVIARRVAQQQERMRQEFLKEEAQKKERQVQRCSQMEEFRRRQEESRKSEKARFLRSKSSVKESTDDHTSFKQQNLDHVCREEVQSTNQSSHSTVESRHIPQIVRKSDEHPVVNSRQPWRRFPETEDEAVASITPRSCRENGIDLDDSLPIPVFRAKSPVIPALRTTVEMGQPTVSANSKGMQMLEAKWQVPAVQKTNMVPTAGFLGDGSKGCPKTILTQLGAFRRQLQIEQMRMEEIVQKRNQPNLI